MFSQESYRALTTSAAAVVRRDRGVLVVSGSEAAAWLQGLLTNDVHSVVPGRAVYSAYLTPQGRMVTDMRLVPHGDAIAMDVPGQLAAGLRARLDALIFAEDVQVADRSEELTLVEVIGPQAERHLAAVRAAVPDVARDESSGTAGYLALVPHERVTATLAALAEDGVPEATLDALEVVRVELGIPRFLADMSEETIPLEAGLENRAISFTKGCYVGQELIVRVLHRGGGRVARKLMGLVVEPDGPTVEAGAAIRKDAREIGQVTSAIVSPAFGGPIALGYVHRDFAEAGTTVEIVGSSGPVTATVAALPFAPRHG